MSPASYQTAPPRVACLSIAAGSQNEAVRLGVEAAIVDGALVRGDVEIVDGLVAQVGLSSRGGRGVAVPGLVDLQVNGSAGVDLLRADEAGYREEVHRTYLHELGHYLGLNEDELTDRGLE